MRAEYTCEALAEAVTRSSSWAELMRVLEVKASGGRRRALQQLVAAHAIDTSHFKQRSPWSKYSDMAIAEAVATSTTLREVVEKLGTRPATGTLSHIRRRIAASGIDISHIAGLNRPHIDLPFSHNQLREAALSGDSIRSVSPRVPFKQPSRTARAMPR
ncbi:hypothetical protein [Streptomyces sp. NPDC059455]|uniref:hypothetical protein n=1 Tax=Streptomyces sp. NPDC059455 TaxID=3346837 RepID=UPI003674C857